MVKKENTSRISKLVERKHGFKRISVGLCLGFLLLLGGGLMGCSSEPSPVTEVPQKSQSEKLEGYSIYRLGDSLLEEDYKKFREDKASMNTLVAFYNYLNQSDELSILSIFNQALYVKDFKGDKAFYYTPEEVLKADPSLTPSIKGIEINQKAFDFYQLKLAEGKAIAWEKVNYQDGTKLPILLGYQYKGVYQLGEVLEIDLYGKLFQCEVVGFLSQETKLNYKGYGDENLDNYIIFPYPSKLWHLEDIRESFAGILYFAMLNSEVATRGSEEDLLSEIKLASEKSGFKNFALYNQEGYPLKLTYLMLNVS